MTDEIKADAFLFKSVLIQGPQCSGKTTISKKIREILRPHIESVNVLISPGIRELSGVCVEQLYGRRLGLQRNNILIVFDEFSDNWYHIITNLPLIKTVIENTSLYQVTVIFIQQDNTVYGGLTNRIDVKITTDPMIPGLFHTEFKKERTSSNM